MIYKKEALIIGFLEENNPRAKEVLAKDGVDIVHMFDRNSRVEVQLGIQRDTKHQVLSSYTISHLDLMAFLFSRMNSRSYE